MVTLWQPLLLSDNGHFDLGGDDGDGDGDGAGNDDGGNKYFYCQALIVIIGKGGFNDIMNITKMFVAVNIF